MSFRLRMIIFFSHGKSPFIYTCVERDSEREITRLVTFSCIKQLEIFSGVAVMRIMMMVLEMEEQ